MTGVNHRTGAARAAGLALLFLFLFASLAGAGMRDRASETVLPNGLKVILLENHKAPTVSFQVWYRVGSRNEEWGKTGISHMLEHMMFRGTQKVSPQEFIRAIRENGGNFNAFTSQDFTAYFENIRSDRIDICLDLEADRMQNLLLREEDFRNERMVVMEERRMRTEDNFQAYLLEQVEAMAYKVHPYHWPTIGWMQDLGDLTLDDLREYYRMYYHPSNAFLVAVGDFQKEDLLPRIRKAFGPIPAGPRPQAREIREPLPAGERRVQVRKEARLPFLLMGYPVPNLRDRDGYVLEVLAALFSAGRSSRFPKTLVREKQLALEGSADHPLLSRDRGLFYLSVVPMPGINPGAVEKAVDREIERIRNELAGELELEKVKNRLESDFVFAQDSCFYRGMLLARHEIAGSWRMMDRYLPSIRSVTGEEVRRAARQYLVSDHRTVGVLLPLPAGAEKPSPPGSAKIERMIRWKGPGNER